MASDPVRQASPAAVPPPEPAPFYPPAGGGPVSLTTPAAKTQPVVVPPPAGSPPAVAGMVEKSGETPPEPEASSQMRVWQQVRPILILIAALFAFRSSVIDWNDVPTGSMNPTIVEGDRILVNKLAYDLKVPFTTWHIAEWGQPKRGEIVVFFSPEDGIRLVKRCVAVPGDTIEVRNNLILINGKPLDYSDSDGHVADAMSNLWKVEHRVFTEKLGDHTHAVAVMPYRMNPKATYAQVTVPEGKFFMMGDNRDNSKDSRYFGFVNRSEIVGRATAVALSVDWGGDFPWVHPRWRRFFSKLP